jgi:PleD family two-component response regulator
VGGEGLRITLSVGVAERHPGEARDALMARADEALNVAKNSGRNRVELAA